jgi:hypothetical protein
MKKDNYFENTNNNEHFPTTEEEGKNRKSNAANKIPISQSPAKPPIIGHEIL